MRLTLQQLWEGRKVIESAYGSVRRRREEAAHSLGSNTTQIMESKIRKVVIGYSIGIAALTVLYLARRLVTGTPISILLWTLSVGACGVSGLMYIAALKASREILPGILLFFTSLVFSLVIGELVLSVFFPLRRGADWWEPMMKRRAGGEVIYPTFGFNSSYKLGSGRQFLSGIGSVLTAGTGGVSESLADKHGFTNPPGYYDQYDQFDIFAVGDSFVHGGQIVSVIRGRLRASTYNAGYSGDGPLEELATLVEYGTTKRPKILLWFYYEGNDLRDLSWEMKYPFLTKYLSDSRPRGLVNQVEARDSILKGYLNSKLDQFATRKERMRRYLDSIVSWLRDFPESTELAKRFYGLPGRLMGLSIGTMNLDMMPTFCNTMNIARKTAERWAGRLVFVYLPEYRRFVYRERYADQGRLGVLECVNQLGIPVIDMTPQFSSRLNAETFFSSEEIEAGEWKHYSAAGYHFVGSTVAEFLTKEFPGRLQNQGKISRRDGVGP